MNYIIIIDILNTCFCEDDVRCHLHKRLFVWGFAEKRQVTLLPLPSWRANTGTGGWVVDKPPPASVAALFLGAVRFSSPVCPSLPYGVHCRHVCRVRALSGASAPPVPVFRCGLSENKKDPLRGLPLFFFAFRQPLSFPPTTCPVMKPPTGHYKH